MSEENVKLTRRAIEAYNARDAEAFIAICDPNIELHSVFAAVGGTVYQGHDGMRKFSKTSRKYGETRFESSLRRTSISVTTHSCSM